jgi:thiamine biosynthesis lipoprotein
MTIHVRSGTLPRRRRGGSRRTVVLALVATVAALVGGGGGVGLRAAPLLQSGGVSREFRYIMGTSIEVRAFNGDEEGRAAAIEEAFAAFAEVDRVMSDWRDDSELASVNRNAATSAVPVSDPLFSVVEAAVNVSDHSDGAFDVTVGPLVKLWGFHDRKPRIPTSSELAALRPVVSSRNLILDRVAHTIRFARPGVEIDLGGIAKGFAVELAAGVLRRHGLDGFIDAGGNQYLLGLPPGRTSWTVGIQNPDHPDKLLGTLDLLAGSVSTSGGYENFLTINGRRYGHIIDPRTMQPSTASLSATVVSPDGTLADAASKVAFILGPNGGLAFVDSIPRMMALVAYRKADGRVGIAMSERLKPLFHPVRTD